MSTLGGIRCACDCMETSNSFFRVCVPWSRGFGNTPWCGWTLSPEGARLDRYVEDAALI